MKIAFFFYYFYLVCFLETNAQQLTARGSYTKKLDSTIHQENPFTKPNRYKIQYLYYPDIRMKQKIFYAWDSISNSFKYNYNWKYTYVGDSIEFRYRQVNNSAVIDTYKLFIYKANHMKIDSFSKLKNNTWQYTGRKVYYENAWNKYDSTKEYFYDVNTNNDHLSYQYAYEYDNQGNETVKNYNLISSTSRDYFVSKLYDANQSIYMMTYGSKRYDSSLIELLIYDQYGSLDSAQAYSRVRFSHLSYDSIVKSGYTKFKYDYNVDKNEVLMPYENQYYGRLYNKMLLEESELDKDHNTFTYVKFYYSDIQLAHIEINSNVCMTIAPNPCSSCELITSKQIDTKDYIVSDIIGQQINVSFEKSTNGYKIHLPKESRGIYFLQNIQSSEVIRFVKE